MADLEDRVNDLAYHYGLMESEFKIKLDTVESKLDTLLANVVWLVRSVILAILAVGTALAINYLKT